MPNIFTLILIIILLIFVLFIRKGQYGVIFMD